MDVTSFLEQHVNQIDGIIQATCRKKNIIGEQARDFRSYVYEKLLENDAKRLKDFQGNYKTSWVSYLSIVITRLAIDFIKKHWGRWENSSVAKMLGDAAMKLETLIYRDKFSFFEASAILLESPEYALLHRLSDEELERLKNQVPDTTFKKLASSSKPTLYLKREFEIQIKEFLSKTEEKYLPIIYKLTELKLCQEILEEWEIMFQGRMPIRRSAATNFGNQKNQDDSDLDLIENIADENQLGPLESLLDEELENQLERVVDILMDDLDNEDWIILSFYLIDNLRISEIARMLDADSDSLPEDDNKKSHVSSKSWKNINKRISHFSDQLKRQIKALVIDLEDRETVSQFCLYLITKKLQKNH